MIHHVLVFKWPDGIIALGINMLFDGYEYYIINVHERMITD